MGETRHFPGDPTAWIRREFAGIQDRREGIGDVNVHTSGEGGTRSKHQFHGETLSGASPARQFPFDGESTEMSRRE